MVMVRGYVGACGYSLLSEVVRKYIDNVEPFQMAGIFSCSLNLYCCAFVLWKILKQMVCSTLNSCLAVHAMKNSIYAKFGLASMVQY